MADELFSVMIHKKDVVLQDSFKQGCNTSLKRVGNLPHKTELKLYFELWLNCLSV